MFTRIPKVCAAMGFRAACTLHSISVNLSIEAMLLRWIWCRLPLCIASILMLSKNGRRKSLALGLVSSHPSHEIILFTAAVVQQHFPLHELSSYFQNKTFKHLEIRSRKGLCKSWINHRAFQQWKTIPNEQRWPRFPKRTFSPFISKQRWGLTHTYTK